MDRAITDLIYCRTVKEKSAEVELAVYKMYRAISACATDTDFVKLEEELNTVYSMVEKELFYRGFTEGMRFLLDLM